MFKQARVIVLVTLVLISLRMFAVSLTLSSPDFDDNSLIPAQFTCEGANVAPTLVWQDPPANTKSLALIMDDPDAPHGTWVHWVLFNIPPDTKQLSAKNQAPQGAVSGANSWGNSGYGGPCPPSGTHRYFFKLYALDVTLPLSVKATKQDLTTAMQDHILASAQLVGLYKKH